MKIPHRLVLQLNVVIYKKMLDQINKIVEWETEELKSMRLTDKQRQHIRREVTWKVMHIGNERYF